MPDPHPLFAGMPAPEVVRLWPEGTPGALPDHGVQEEALHLDGDRIHLRYVSEAELLIHRPPPGVPVQGAVIFFPGGGYTLLSMRGEADKVSAWLTGLGFISVLVKYRLPDDRTMVDKRVGPLQDAQAAVRYLRAHAAEFGIRPDRVGVLGSSAGGHLAGSACVFHGWPVYPAAAAVSARPDFAILVYPVVSMEAAIANVCSRRCLLGENPSEEDIARFSLERHVSADTPPTFIIHAIDDQAVVVENSLRYFNALHRHGVKCELHLYERGGHGFMLGRAGTPSTGWPQVCAAWLRDQGWLA